MEVQEHTVPEVMVLQPQLTHCLYHASPRLEEEEEETESTQQLSEEEVVEVVRVRHPYLERVLEGGPIDPAWTPEQLEALFESGEIGSTVKLTVERELVDQVVEVTLADVL